MRSVLGHIPSIAGIMSDEGFRAQSPFQGEIQEILPVAKLSGSSSRSASASLNAREETRILSKSRQSWRRARAPADAGCRFRSGSFSIAGRKYGLEL